MHVEVEATTSIGIEWIDNITSSLLIENFHSETTILANSSFKNLLGNQKSPNVLMTILYGVVHDKG